MKKLILLLLALALCGCSNKVSDLPMNDYLSLSFKLKDNKEYIMVDQYDDYTSIDFLSHLEISSNKDLDYILRWVGQGLSYAYDTYDDVLKARVYIDEFNTEYQDVTEEFINKDKSDTLKCDGFVPITLYLETEFNGEKVSRRLDTLLLIAPEEYQQDYLHTINGESIEEIYRLLYEHDTTVPKCYGGSCGFYTSVETWNEKGYATTMRGY